MKQYYLKGILLCLSLFVGLNLFAYDALIDGIYYDFNGDDAEVTYRDPRYNSYSGIVVIPESITYNSKTYSVTRIGDYAFYNCSSLRKVYSLAEEIPTTKNSAFDVSPIVSATLYVPESAIEQYQVTKPWSGFGTITALTIDGIKPIENGKLTMANDAEAWYDLNGCSFNKPKKGINIIRYSDGTSRKVLVK